MARLENKKPDYWLLFFTFFMSEGNKDVLTRLLKSNSFDSDFNSLIDEIQNKDANELVSKVINTMLNKKQMLKDINDAIHNITDGEKEV